MTATPAEGGTIFMFERKTLWLSNMWGRGAKTNWLRIWLIIAGAQVLVEFLRRQSVPEQTAVKTNRAVMLGVFFFCCFFAVMVFTFWKRCSAVITSTMSNASLGRPNPEFTLRMNLFWIRVWCRIPLWRILPTAAVYRCYKLSILFLHR